MNDQRSRFRRTSDAVQNEFITWTTLGSLTGMVAIVTMITKIAPTLNKAWTSSWIPFISALVLIEIYTLLTFDWNFGSDSPAQEMDASQQDKLLVFLKAIFISLINGLIVYATYMGIDVLPEVVSG